MASESVIFTALPNGVDETGRFLKLAVFVSPRLSTDGAGLQPLQGSGFKAFEDWPATLARLAFVAVVDGIGDFEAARDDGAPQADSDLWQRLLGVTSVRDGGFTDLSTRRIRSFSVAAASASVLDLYGEIAESHPAAFPPITSGRLARLGRDLGQLGSVKNEFYPTLDNLIGQETGPAGKTGRYLERSLITPQNRERMAFAEAYRFYDRPGTRDPLGPGVTPEPPKAPEIDFHRAIAVCGDYPALLRHLGLVIDLLVRRDGAIPAGGRLRVAVKSTSRLPTWMSAEPARPWTHYQIQGPRFLAEPRQKEGDLVDGTLRLENTRAFLINQIDVDGSAMKTVDFAGNLQRLNDHLNQHTRSLVEDQSSLPALRTGGFTIARDDRAKRVVAHLDAAADLEVAHAGGVAPDLFTEDVNRGYRLDIEDKIRPDRWLSLHRRSGSYQIKRPQGAPIDLPIGPDEGFVKSASSASVPGNDSELYLHEALFGWDGWSLAAKRPGQAITNDGAEVIEPENPTDFPLMTSFEATPGTLPRLRFGRDYRFRARAVDLAGNSVREAALVPNHVSEFHSFQRFDPVPSPTVVPRRPFSEGESLMRMVIRSTLNELPPAYVALARVVGLADHDEPLTAYLAVNDRHLAAPNSSQQLAEWHGVFDKAVGHGAAQVSLDVEFDIATKESGSFLAPGPDVFVVNSDPSKTPTDLADPNRRKGDPLQQGEYVCHDVDKVALPYLPDVLSRGLALATLPGDSGPRLTAWEGGGDWHDRRPIRLRIEDGAGAPAYDAAERLMTVFLPQAEMVTVRLSSFLESADLDLMGIWMLERPAFRSAQQIDAEQGQHWMLTPWRPLILVHAVEKPLTPPVINVPAGGIAQSGVKRRTGETLAVLAGTIDNHAKSTGRLDVEARWTEPIDDLARDAPSELKGQAHVGDFLLDRDEAACRIGRDDEPAAGSDPPIHRLRHEFGDTKHRWVHYHSIATTRFREYFPPEITNDPALVTHAGAETLLNVPASRRPEPPEVLYVVPTWTWEERTINRRQSAAGRWVKPTKQRTRGGGGLRVYLDRPWYSSGADELLGVVLEDQPWITWPLDITAGLDKPAVAKALGDELAEKILSQGVIKGAGSAKASPAERLLRGVMKLQDRAGQRTATRAFKRAPDRFEEALTSQALAALEQAAAAGAQAVRFTGLQLAVLEKAISAIILPSGDPQAFVTQWGLDPIWGSAPLPAGPYIHQLPLRVAVGIGVALSEAPGHQVTVVGHEPKFDGERKLWYCDLQFDAGQAYFPFVRLALARYQPHAIAGQHLSKVVFPDFTQLVAERTAAVTMVGRATAAVSLRGPGAYTENADDLVAAFGGLEQLLSLSRIAVAQVERLPANATTDMAWAPLGDEVRLAVSAAGGLADVRFTGRVAVPPRAKGEQLRLALREYEIFQTDESEADDHVGPTLRRFGLSLFQRAVKYRLVYADHLPL